jgi:CxxC motif-containing protein (DUF1111 family)
MRVAHVGSSFLFLGCLVGLLVAQQPNLTGGFGSPLSNLTPAQLSAFGNGQAAFRTVEDVADGLGPVFNEASCAACHTSTIDGSPVIGGSNGRLETRFGKMLNGSFDPMGYAGGSLIQDHGIGLYNGTDFVAEAVPASATAAAQRRTTPLFGLGLVDAVPDDTFNTLAWIEKIYTPASAGTVSLVTDLGSGATVIGKFGWKAQNPTLFQFSGDAYLNEMGITNPEFPSENCPQGDCTLLSANPEPGLNDVGEDVQKFTDFMRFLAPPPRGPVSLRAQAGELVFNAIGCANCHVGTLTTGHNHIAVLDRVRFHPYSDFLLHDMGTLGDGITQGVATGRLMRTAPLWGLRVQAHLLHDGRAATPQDAILAHDGQGSPARSRYNNLPPTAKANLLAFLNSL